jgi:flagellar hook assembly protein FlgD
LIKEEITNLIIYDLNGHVIKQLINSKMMGGEHIVSWDGTNDQGILVSPGVYYYTLKIGNSFQETKKMIFIR